MDDQAVVEAVESAAEIRSVEDRIAAALGEAPEAPPNLERPEVEQLPQGKNENLPPEEQETAPAEEAKPAEEDPIDWDEFKAVKLKVPLKRDGTEEQAELTLDDLRLGYMRQDDYQRKTQEVARTRAEAEAQARSRVQQIEQQVSQELRAMEAFIDNVAVPEFKQVDWNRLAAEDPAQFVQLSHRQQQVLAAKQQVKQQLQAIEEQRSAELQSKRAQAIAQAREELPKRIPNWNDELRSTLIKTGQETGFSAEELESVIDPRFVQLLHEAHQYRQMQKATPVIEKRVSEAPKVLKPSAPKPQSSEAKTAQDLKARIRKSGGRDTAAIEALIQSRMR
jgi:hypothetical protein